MSRRLKMLPAFFMLSAGTITSVITYVLHYEGKTALTILLGVLLLFYIIGKLFQTMIVRFENQNEEEKKKQAMKEGTVVEREAENDEQEEAAEEETAADVEETREQ